MNAKEQFSEGNQEIVASLLWFDLNKNEGPLLSESHRREGHVNEWSSWINW